jgi:hypothetical protein
MSFAFFIAEHTQLSLSVELQGWIGTRFSRECGARAKKGICADCVSFVERVLVNVGAIQPIDWPQYVNVGGGEAMREKLLQVLQDIPNMQAIWHPLTGDRPDLLPGDVFVRSVKSKKPGVLDSHHMGIYGGDKALWHCIVRLGVTTVNVNDTFAIQELQGIYRVYAADNH